MNKKSQSLSLLHRLADDIKRWVREAGFQQVGISDVDLKEHEFRLLDWLKKGFHGKMSYMERHGVRRSRPEELLPGTVRVISARMDYWPPAGKDAMTVLNDDALGYVSRYALGRDYHKVMRNRLQRLARQIEQAIGPFGYRVFSDSAPVLEKALAEKAGLGWIGKHSNLLTRRGSWFFLGEIYVDIPLPVDQPTVINHCGRCNACIEVCPTRAIVSPYQVDARRCISYLTIELRESIPEALRPLLGNRIYGCDDCQLACPWNRFAVPTPETDFLPRQGLDCTTLLELFAWTEEEFYRRTEGSPIRRIGYDCWQRNIAVALGNARVSEKGKTVIVGALRGRLQEASTMVREHIEWALQQHGCL